MPESMCSSPRGMMAPCLWPRPCFMGLHGAPGDIMCKACSLPLFILLSWLNALTPLVSVGPGRSLPFTEVPRRRSHPLKTKGKLRPCRGRQLQRLAFQSRAPFSALQWLELTGSSVSEDWVGPQMGLFLFPYSPKGRAAGMAFIPILLMEKLRPKEGKPVACGHLCEDGPDIQASTLGSIQDTPDTRS